MSNARILVVDDEADIRDLVQEILSEEGYAVDVAANAAEARAACVRQAPDLVLLDIWMPDTDGISLLREWQQTQSLTAPVVMMSGHGTVETAVEATRLGAVDYVEKPLSLTKLLRTVTSALEEGGRRRQTARGNQRLERLLGFADRRTRAERAQRHAPRLLGERRLEGPGDGAKQLLQADRLLEKVEGADLGGLDGRLDRAVTRHHDDRARGAAFGPLAQQ